MTQFQVGCDIGGTFTDVAAVDDKGHVYTDKADTTPEDLSGGLLAALNNLCERVGIDERVLLENTTRFVNGTTVVTNSIAELKGAKVGLITTAGFGDNLLIARSARNAHRDHHKQLNLPQVVPRDRVVEVVERVDRKGRAVVGLTADAARDAIARLTSQGVEAIAVSLLWSFVNPEHEALIASIIEEEHPGLFVSVSHRLNPVIREYERTMTTVLNAFTGLRVSDYTKRIERQLFNRGLRVPVAFMQGFGGALAPEEARDSPIALVDSGPAGGVIGAQDLARRLGLEDVVTADMGGTSFDVSVLQGAKPRITQRVMLRDQYLTALSKIDVLPIGAGGGSTAWLDARHVPQVGPSSAGARPGPVCYAQGGTAATVTDAAAVLGMLAPKAFFGGRRELDVEAARTALSRDLGKELGLDGQQAAAAVYRMVTANMSNAVRAVTVERGHDPRGFALFAFGGAVGIFAADIATSLGIRTVVLPGNAAVFSAHGLLASDDVRSQARSAIWTGGDVGHVATTLRELEDSQIGALHAAGYASEDITVEWEGDFKFAGQQWELSVPLPHNRELDEKTLGEVRAEFPRRYEAEYGQGTAWVESPIVLMSVRVIATGKARRYQPLPAPTNPDRPPRSVGPSGRREIYMPSKDTSMEVDIYDASALPPGTTIAGPAMVEHPLTTMQVPENWTLGVDEWNNHILSVNGGAQAHSQPNLERTSG